MQPPADHLHPENLPARGAPSAPLRDFVWPAAFSCCLHILLLFLVNAELLRPAVLRAYQQVSLDLQDVATPSPQDTSRAQASAEENDGDSDSAEGSDPAAGSSAAEEEEVRLLESVPQQKAPSVRKVAAPLPFPGRGAAPHAAADVPHRARHLAKSAAAAAPVRPLQNLSTAAALRHKQEDAPKAPPLQKPHPAATRPAAATAVTPIPQAAAPATAQALPTAKRTLEGAKSSAASKTPQQVTSASAAPVPVNAAAAVALPMPASSAPAVALSALKREQSSQPAPTTAPKTQEKVGPSVAMVAPAQKKPLLPPPPVSSPKPARALEEPKLTLPAAPKVSAPNSERGLAAASANGKSAGALAQAAARGKGIAASDEGQGRRTAETPAPKAGPERDQESQKSALKSVPQGDLELEIVGAARSVKGPIVAVAYTPYPENRHKKPMTLAESKKVKTLVPVVARTADDTIKVVVEIAAAGVYELRWGGQADEMGEARCVLTVNASGRQRKTRRLGARKPADERVIAKILMPEGILWDEEGSFSGSIEDGESVTKYQSETGLTWKEYRR